MEPELLELPAFTVVGYRLTAPMSEAQDVIPPFWGDLEVDGRLDHLLALIDPLAQPPGVLGVAASSMDAPDGEDLHYYAAVIHPGPTPKGLDRLDVPAATWAVFGADGDLPAAVQDTIGAIFDDWLPTSGFLPAQLPLVECYLEPPRQLVMIAITPGD